MTGVPVRIGATAHILGQFLLTVCGAMAIPLGIALVDRDGGLRALFEGLSVTLLAGGALVLCFPKPRAALTTREALLTVMMVWIAVAFFGCLPFYFSPYFNGFTDAFFESSSGFTTTGATILTRVEVLPTSLQFWRHFSHWIGGMGIVMLGIAILPLVGVGGQSLYNAQFAGAPSEKLKPRVLETAHALWKVYLGITIAEVIALWWAGMSLFDAICHTFSTLGTGGFSTHTESIGYFASPAIEAIVIVFMVLSSLNFASQYRMWVEHRPIQFLRDPEVRFHLCVLLAAVLGLGAMLSWRSGISPLTALREAAFQVVSIGTTTGFVTADYELWHPFAQITLLVLMYLGGNTSSTAGGFKTFRVLVLLRVVRRAAAAISRPRQVVAVRIGRTPVPDAALTSLLNLVILALFVNFGASVLLAGTGLDPLTAFSAVPACMFSVGPALGSVRPAENYAHLASFAKWILIAVMLVGRVELYTALVLITPAFWRG